MPTRGGTEVALGVCCITFLIYRTCVRRAPARPVRACFVGTCCPVVVQEHDLRRAPAQRNSKRTLSSHFTLRSSHPALHTSHLHFISTHLIRAFLISFHVFSYVSYSQVLLDYFHFIWAQLNLSHLTEASLNPSRLFCTLESLRHRCIYSEKSLQNTLYYKACAKHFPVLFWTTKLAQRTPQ